MGGTRTASVVEGICLLFGLIFLFHVTADSGLSCPQCQSDVCVVYPCWNVAPGARRSPSAAAAAAAATAAAAAAEAEANCASLRTELSCLHGIAADALAQAAGSRFRGLMLSSLLPSVILDQQEETVLQTFELIQARTFPILRTRTLTPTPTPTHSHTISSTRSRLCRFLIDNTMQ